MDDDSTGDLTGRSRIVGNVIVSWLSHLVMFISGFVMPRMIDNSLGQVELGIWDFCWSIVAYITMAHLGIGASLNRYVAKARAEGDTASLETYVSTVFVIQQIIALAVLVATFVVAVGLEYLDVALTPDQYDLARNVLLLLGISLAVQYVFDTSRGVLTGCHRWDLFNGLAAIIQLLTVSSMLVLLLLGYGLVELAIAYLVTTAIHGVIRSLLARKICPDARIRLSKTSLGFGKEIFVFGAKSFVLSVNPLIVVQLTYLLLATSLGPALLAVFVRPVALVRHIATFITRFTFVLTPMASSIQSMENDQSVRDFTIQSAKFGFAFTAPAIAAFCYLGADVIEVWMGIDYVVPEIILLLGLGFLLPVSQSPISRVLIGLNYHGRIALISLVTTLVVYGLVYSVLSLEPLSLMTFAILVAVVGTVTDGLLVPILACRKLGISYWYYLAAVFGRVGGINGVGLAVLVLLDFLIGENLTGRVVSLAGYGVLVLIMYWMLLLSTEQKRLVPMIGARFS